jgi:hypothetical protein
MRGSRPFGSLFVRRIGRSVAVAVCVITSGYGGVREITRASEPIELPL